MIERPATGWKMERVMTHPGAILFEDFLKPLEMSKQELASRLHVASELIEGICSEQLSITTDMALRLGHFFGTTAQWWLNMQMNHDLTKAELGSGKKLREEIQPLDKAA